MNPPLPPGEGRGEGSPITRQVAALAAGLALATSPLYWSQATIPEVYALHAAIILGALALIAAWRPHRDRLVVALALLFGLGLGNHMTLILLAGLAAPFLVLQDPGLLRRRVGILAPTAFLLGLLVYLYLPIRASADPPLNWGNPSDGPRFVAHVTARAYQGYFGIQDPGHVPARIRKVARGLVDQYTWPGLAVALVGLAALIRKRRALAALLAGYLALTVAFALLYNTRDGEVFLLPAVLVLALGVGVGATLLATTRRRRFLAIAAAIALAAWQINLQLPRMDLSEDGRAAAYARGALATAPPESVLLTKTDEETFALWYVQVVEGLRPDVVVVDRRALAMDWYRAEIERRRPGLVRQLLP